MAVGPQGENQEARSGGPSGSLAVAVGLDTPALMDAPVAVYAVDLAGRLCLWNRAAERMFGWTADEVLGQLPPFVDEDGFESALTGLTRILEGTDFFNAEFSPLHRDGHAFDVIHSASLLRDPDGQPAAVIVFARDVTDEQRAAQRLADEEHKWRQLAVRTTDTITLATPDGSVIESTGELKDGVMGYSAGFWRGRSGFDLIHPDDLPVAAEAWSRVAAGPGARVREVFRTRYADGHYELMEFEGANLTDDPGVGGIVVSTRNVSALRRTETLLADEARVLELIARDTPMTEVLPEIVELVEYHTAGAVGIFFVDEYSGYIGVASIGSMPEELVEVVSVVPVARAEDGHGNGGRAGIDLRKTQTAIDLAADPDTAAIAPAVAELGFRAAWSHPIIESRTDALFGVITVWYPERREPTDHERKVAEVASHLAAIAIERDGWQRQLYQQARFDGLTGLPNRTLVLETLDDTVARARARGEAVAVLFVDLDRFKLINDSHGHRVGDQLITEFARRLREVVRPEFFVGHLGADEFVVVLGPGTTRAEAELVAHLIDVVLDRPFEIGESRVFLGVSTGIALSEHGAETAETLLQQADAAMYKAKQAGRNRSAVFDEALRTRAVERLQTDRDLRVALERSELALYYQPEIDLHTGSIVGAEALLRWIHPERGLIAPDRFIGIAEDTGVIVPIGYWVLEEAVRQARAWADTIDGIDDFTVSLNLSARQLRNKALVDTVSFVLTRYAWPPSRLVLELTESILIEDQDETMQTLQRLRLLGVQLAIDDFGTGFASLEYLQRLTVDTVKIDRSFVTPLRADGEGSPVAAAIMHMASSFGLQTTAEGVETPDQVEGLRAIGCQLAQGFLFDRPLPAPDFTARLEADVARRRAAGLLGPSPVDTATAAGRHHRRSRRER